MSSEHQLVSRRQCLGQSAGLEAKANDSSVHLLAGARLPGARGGIHHSPCRRGALSEFEVRVNGTQTVRGALLWAHRRGHEGRGQKLFWPSPFFKTEARLLELGAGLRRREGEQMRAALPSGVGPQASALGGSPSTAAEGTLPDACAPAAPSLCL